MDKSIYLQKQVRDNSEDLRKELREMLDWEEEMKRKDFEIRNAKGEQELPPVRSKKKKQVEPSPQESSDEEQIKEKNTSATDYKSWEKFDVDKACKKIDGKNVPNVREEIEFEIPSKEELEKEHAEATKYKNEGNALVKEKEYAKAVGKYNQAIRLFSGDATFYANRALCQLKLDNLHSAEGDCTQAIKLDETYVKAYHRRAMARMELKHYKDAQKDFEKVLVLEPSNKEAALKLKQVAEKIEKSSKPMIISGASSIEKNIGKKLFEKKSLISKSSDSSKEKKNENAIVKSKPNTSNKNLLIEDVTEESVSKTSVKTKENSNTATTVKVKNSEDDLPPWLPKLKEGVTIVQPSNKASRPFKKALKKVEIKEIPDDESIFSDIVKENFVEKKVADKSKILKNSKAETKNNVAPCNVSQIKETEIVPPPPKTSVGFFINWRKSSSVDFRYEYLKQIKPQNFPAMMKASMESPVFSDILTVLNTKFLPKEDKVYEWLYYLSKLERFRALLLFMTSADKEAVKNLLDYCKTKEGKTDDEVNSLYAAYEL